MSKVGGQVTDRTVRSLHVAARLSVGQVIVKQPVCGVVFSFPAAVWPLDAWRQKEWIERLTPWWDMDAPDWTPQATRLRESCVKAISALVPVPEKRDTANARPEPERVSDRLRADVGHEVKR